MKGFPQFILASRSPRRQQLLREAGYDVAVMPPPLEEPPLLAHGNPSQLAQALAYFKASSVLGERPDRLVLGADTLVVRDQELMGKADDPDQARRMLQSLSGSRHRVITGLAMLIPPCRQEPPGPRERFLASETTYVTMRPLSGEEIDGYIALNEWRDKAGAYAIQESGDAFIEKIEGSWSNVMGLPMELLDRMFRQVLRLVELRNGTICR